MRYSPGARRAIELLEIDDIGKHEIMDGFDRNLVEKGFDMGKPGWVGMRSAEAM
ncbi:hypothetical protein IGS68_14900 [Skermanella sp. TT6]|uniref:Uncharacterized protein n=1 Tax=Skermanella cutis TaxID=2775420 RepID=A0ABX7B4G4_9PROT|nr:hypothetical protein [Skermanella sp. TT6]QQP87406.1 hypothetical protein IGS68_14900 [Skermanella sp. TT6]